MSELRRLPTGIQTFSEVREEGYLYVDKTETVYRLANDNKYVFMSRPRRFGKSLLCSTLKSYFEGRRDLFEGLAIEKLEKDWRKHPVLLISLAPIKGGTLEDFNERMGLQLSRLEEQFGLSDNSGMMPGARLEKLITETSKKEKAVVIVDEYDAPMLTVLHDKEKLEDMRNATRSLLSSLKDCDPYLRFVFITGITRFSQVSIFSELNNLSKVTMMTDYSTICGFTQEELETQLRPWVEKMAETCGMSVEETLAELKRRYDGYHFAKDLTNIYNPYSLLNALRWKEFNDFWFDSGTPSSLLRMMERFGSDVMMFDDGCDCESAEFDAPTEKMQTPMPFFYQSGYLTIKEYDATTNRFILRYPNYEVRMGMINALVPYYMEQNTINAKNIIYDLFKAIRSDNLEMGLQKLQTYLASVPYAANASSEGHYQTMLYVVFSLLGRYVQMEVRTAKGRIDIVFETKTDRYVMELKIDRPAQEALDQIDQKGYLLPYTLDGHRLHKVGISFSTETRTLSEWKIEELKS
ncbi:MAG: ATP-binding protein [Prevotella sp.]|nr:ATP-binding protein [Prevotella sp.]